VSSGVVAIRNNATVRGDVTVTASRLELNATLTVLGSLELSPDSTLSIGVSSLVKGMTKRRGRINNFILVEFELNYLLTFLSFV